MQPEAPLAQPAEPAVKAEEPKTESISAQERRDAQQISDVCAMLHSDMLPGAEQPKTDA